MMTPRCECLACGYPFEAAASAENKRVSPEPGDVSICLMCGHLMVFNRDLTVRELTDNEMHEVAADPRILKIQQARGSVVQQMKRKMQ